MAENITQQLLQSINNKFDVLIDLVRGFSFAQSVVPVSQKPPCPYTVFEWFNKWLNEIHIDNVSTNTFKNDCGRFKNHVFNKNQFDKLLIDFKSNDLISLVNSIQLSRQRQIASNHIVAALRSAFDNDLLPKDITKNYNKPDHEYEEDRAATKIEEAKLLRYLSSDKYRNIYMLYLYAGLRRNEALGLYREHFDFDKNEIYIMQQVDLKNNITSKLKTKTSYRTIKMFPELKSVLLEYKNHACGVRLFTVSPNTIGKHFERVCTLLCLHDFSIKSLRTTFATRCNERGIPNDIIQAWMGHGSFKTTKKHYIKISAEYVENEFKKALKTQL